MDLKGKTAIITGGSRGIGRAIAIKLASKGANIAFTYNSNDEQASSLVKEMLSYQVKAKAYKVDVRDFEKTVALKNEIYWLN